MDKRKLLFGTYDTAEQFWTLSACHFADAAPVTNMLNVPGRLDGPLDLSTALTGDILYGTRALDTKLESSEGTRLERENRIHYMVNMLHGQRVRIWLPDDPNHYVVGRLNIKTEYNDLAHAAVKVTATCEPWRYENEETVYDVTVSGNTTEVTLENARRPACPVLTVQGAVRLEFDGNSYALNEGTHQLPSLYITHEGQTVKVSGNGSVTFTYRKAVL